MAFKSKTNYALKSYYKIHGIAKTIEIAEQMLRSRKHKDDRIFQAEVHGEICEAICELSIKDFMLKNKEFTKDWIISKGLILKDPEGNNGYLTELDITLFTPYKILVIECKSYGGDKTFVDRCTVKRKGIKSFDVYSQHEKHYRTLMKNFIEFQIKTEENIGAKPLRVAYFNFSLGLVTDMREEKWKRNMPVLDTSSIIFELKKLCNPQVNWRMDYVKRAVNLLEKKKNVRTHNHLNYVKRLHSNSDTNYKGYKGSKRK